jgi:hypothetical protein
LLARDDEEGKSEAAVIRFVSARALAANRDAGAAIPLPSDDLPWQARLSATTGASCIRTDP